MSAVFAKRELFWNPLSVLGQGQYGLVQKVMNGKGEFAAAKIIESSRFPKKVQKMGHDVSIWEVINLRLLEKHGVPHVPKLLEFNRNFTSYEDFRLSIITELVPEKNMWDLYVRERRITVKEAAFALHKALEVLRVLAGIRPVPLLHRDIKPNNMILAGQIFRLIDWASADFVFCQLQPDSYTTKGYESGELMLWGEYSNLTDLFSLGMSFLTICSRHPAVNWREEIEEHEILLSYQYYFENNDMATLLQDTTEEFCIPGTLTLKPIPFTPTVKVREAMSSFIKEGGQDVFSLLLKMTKFAPKERISIEDAYQESSRICESLKLT